MTTAKQKVSLTLSADLVQLIDRDARRHDYTRSGVVEQWLRRAANGSVAKEVEDATAAYYLALRGGPRAEDEALARALSTAARRVAYDDRPRARRRRPAGS